MGNIGETYGANFNGIYLYSSRDSLHCGGALGAGISSGVCSALFLWASCAVERGERMTYKIKSLEENPTKFKHIKGYTEAQNRAKELANQLSKSVMVINEDDGAVLVIAYVIPNNPSYSAYLIPAISGVTDNE